VDLETFSWLLTDAGQELLAEAMRSDLSEGARLRTIHHLRRQATPERAAAAYETALLRRRAASKFSRAESMYFTREALEQASGEAIARYRAARYARLLGHPPGTVADLACGIGGDALALAGVARVVAVDRDPLRLAIAGANARAYGVAGQLTFLQADLEDTPPPNAAAIFFDPARRSAGRRVFALAGYHPPVTLVERWRERTPAIGVKIGPGVADQELVALADPSSGSGSPLEVEFISVDGELKEAVLWFGPLAEPGRRATLLTTADRRPPTTDHRPPTAREGEEERGRGGEERNLQRTENRKLRTESLWAADNGRWTHISLFNAQGAIQPSPPLASPGAYLYEPDPAVIRAHVIATLAAQLGAAQLDPSIAYLTADRLVATPFARCWRVIEWLPFSLKRLRARLRELDAGAVTVKKRGSPLDTDALARKLSGAGARPLVVVLTQVMGRPAALICEGPISTSQ
jgi:SAM-dependent methyltransferase